MKSGPIGDPVENCCLGDTHEPLLRCGKVLAGKENGRKVPFPAPSGR